MKDWNWTPRAKAIGLLLEAIGILAWFYIMTACLFVLIG